MIVKPIISRRSVAQTVSCHWTNLCEQDRFRKYWKVSGYKLQF